MNLNNNPTCEICGNTMKEIVYGLPSGIPTEEDNWVLGGCTVIPDAPDFICTKCESELV